MFDIKKWTPIDKVIEVVKDSIDKTKGWHWIRNTRCKYIEIRVDMRDGHCLIFDQFKKEITLEELKHQYKSKD